MCWAVEMRVLAVAVASAMEMRAEAAGALAREMRALVEGVAELGAVVEDVELWWGVIVGTSDERVRRGALSEVEVLAILMVSQV
jgi:hypothetical protein